MHGFSRWQVVLLSSTILLYVAVILFGVLDILKN